MMNDRKIRVYVAGPYANGDMAKNVSIAMDVTDALIKFGHAPFCPHLCHFLQLRHEHPVETWLALDFEWLRVCDVMLRLPGYSPGADKEETEALKCGIPVVKITLPEGHKFVDYDDLIKKAAAARMLEIIGVAR